MLLSKFKKNKCIFIIVIVIILIIIIFRCIFINNFENFEYKIEQDASQNTLQSSTTSTTYIICEDFYNAMEDYILSFYKKLNAKIVLFNTPDEIPKLNNYDIYIFVKYLHKEQLEQLNDDTKNVYLLNTEQLHVPFVKERLNSYPKYIKILDYSKENLKYYDGYYTKFLQYQLNYDEIYNLPKTKNICIIPNITTYRQNIINELQNKGVNIDIISGWKKERDEKLFTYKILVNLCNEKDYKIFESIRCDRCIFNRMIVISDKKDDMYSYYLKDYIIFEDYNKITDKIIDVINNYDMYYKKLGLDTLDLNKLQIEPVEL
jgi:hypothetical protein